jgi:autotransporter-associated beta strand protein
VAAAAFAALAGPMAGRSSRAADVTSTWFGQTGVWGNAGNWNNVPAVSQFPNNGNGGFTYDAVINSGTVTLDRAITIQKLTLTGGTVGGTPTLTLIEGGGWTGGIFSGPGTVALGGSSSFTISGTATKTIAGRVLSNAGTVLFSSGDVNSGATSGTTRIDNLTSGLFDVQGGNLLGLGSGTTATFNNSGTFRKGTANLFTTTWVFNNPGVINVNAGTLSLEGGGAGAGSFNIAAGATLDLNTYTLNGGASINGPGRLRADNGTLTIAAFATLANVDFSSGSFAGDGTLTLTGAASWTGGTMSGDALGTTAVGSGATFTISGAANKTIAGRTLSNAGTVLFTSGSIRSNAPNSNINNAAGGLFDVQGGDSLVVVPGSTPGTFTNAGTFRKGAANTFDAAWVFNNSGAVRGDAGVLRLSGGGDHTGSFIAAPGATIEFAASNTFQAGSSTTGGGIIQFSAGTSNVAGTYSVTGATRLTGGTLAFTAPAASAGSLLVSGGTLNGVRTLTATDVTNTGGTILTSTGTLRGGAVSLQAGTTTINSGGQLLASTLGVAGGTNSVLAGGRILLGSAASLRAEQPGPAGAALGEEEVLTFTGPGDSTVTLAAHATMPGTVVLGGDVLCNVSPGTARISSVGLPVPIAGTVDLNAAVRTFSVGDGLAPVDMEVSARLANGGLRKGGEGTLRLTAANDHAGGTTVSGGVLEVANPAALGTGPVTFDGGTLNLRATSADTTFPNPLNAAAPAASIKLDVGRDGGGAATVRVPSATIGAALNVTSATASTLIVSGPVTLNADATVNNSAAVTLSGAVGGGFGLTKTLGGTLTLSGAAANTFTGQTVVNEGELTLSKSAGVTGVAGNLRVNGPGSVRLTAPNQIANTAAVIVNGAVQPATLNLNGQAETVASLDNTGTVLTGAGALTVGPVTGATGTVTVGAGGSLTADFVRQGTLTVAGTATLRNRASGGATSAVKSLVIAGATNAWTGKLDLNDSALIVDYTGTSPMPTVSNQIRRGYAGGLWTGNGITSTSAATTSGTALGYAEASAVLGAGGGTFRGQPADGTSVLVRYTLFGDANLDGFVNGTDFALLAGNFGQSNRFWTSGDFNYDLTVNGSDFALLTGNFGKTVPGGAGVGLTAGDWEALESFGAAAGVPVPEPGAAALLAAAGAGLLRRRRSRLPEHPTQG